MRHGQEVLPIEIKVWRDKRADPMEEGLAQFDGDLKGLGVDTGWLVLFDSRTGQPPLPQRTRSAKSSDPLRRHSPPQWQARSPHLSKVYTFGSTAPRNVFHELVGAPWF